MSAHEEREAIARGMEDEARAERGTGWEGDARVWEGYAARVRALPVADDAAGVKRVKVARELVAELRADWSQPVQVKVDHEDRDGDLVLLFKSLPPAPDDAAELAALRVALRVIDRHEEAEFYAVHCDGTRVPSGLRDEYVQALAEAARDLLAKRDGQGVV